MSSNGDKEQRWFREIDAANIGSYTVLIYETWVGDRNDPAVQIEEWTSFFHTEDMPEEVSPAQDQRGIPPYVDNNTRGYGSYYIQRFEGLQGEVLSKQIRIIQEKDHNIEKMKREQEAMLDTKDNYSRYRHSYKGLNYEDFLNAIERVGENEDDEEAWKIIDSWRSRALRQEERV